MVRKVPRAKLMTKPMVLFPGSSLENMLVLLVSWEVGSVTCQRSGQLAASPTSSTWWPGERSPTDPAESRPPESGGDSPDPGPAPADWHPSLWARPPEPRPPAGRLWQPSRAKSLMIIIDIESPPSSHSGCQLTTLKAAAQIDITHNEGDRSDMKLCNYWFSQLHNKTQTRKQRTFVSVNHNTILIQGHQSLMGQYIWYFSWLWMIN